MPDHLHALIEGEREDADCPRAIAMFKQRSSFAFRAGGHGRLWQAGYYDHVLHDDEDTLDVVAYIVANPLRARLVTDVRDYPWLGSTRYSSEQLLEAGQSRRDRWLPRA